MSSSLAFAVFGWAVAAALLASLIFGAGAKRISQLGDFSTSGPSDKEVQALKLGESPSNFFALSAYFFLGGIAAFAAMFLRRLKGRIESCERFPQGLEFLAKRLFQVEPDLQRPDTLGVNDKKRRD
jgi:hypothetical protein